MSAALRFAIVGLDHWYSAIPLARALSGRSDVELVAIADRDIRRAQEVAGQVGCARTSDSPEELLLDPGVDVIASFISVDQNPSVCIAAAQTGKHIMSIKPLARTIEEADAIVAAVREAGVIFMPGESRARHSELNQLLHGWVSSGELGEIVSASFTVSGALPQGWPGQTDPGWWADADRAPGGGWIDHSIYQIDLMRWLLGKEVANISGRVANLRHPDLAFEDYGHAMLEFDGGAMVSIEDTWSGPPGGWRVASSIVGTNGAVNVDTLTGNISLLGQDKPVSGWLHARSVESDSDGIDAMIAAIAGSGELPKVSDAWENLSVCLAFYAASASGGLVKPAHMAGSHS